MTTLTEGRTNVASANIMRTEKTCKGCGATKPRDEFKLKSARKDDRYPWCHDCWPIEKARRLERSRRTDEDRVKRTRAGGPVDRERQIYLDTKRIVEWIDKLPRDEVDHLGNPIGDVQICEWLGTTTRQLFRWRNEPDVTTPLDTFDAMLVKAGVPWVLRELFPELWTFDEDGNPHPAVEGWRRFSHPVHRQQEAA
jgi:hypothetical protein